MFNKEKILEIISQDGFFIDRFLLDAFIKNWKIEAIYEDENGVEYFDEMTIEKIKNGISQKNRSNCEIHVLEKPEEPKLLQQDDEPVHPEHQVSDTPAEIPDEPVYEAQIVEPVELVDSDVEVHSIDVQMHDETAQDAGVSGLPIQVKQGVENALQNVTVDISNQTLAVLAESIARKITSDVSEFLKQSDFIGDAVHLGEVKKDNEVLIKKLEELLQDNKILVQRIRELESENDSYVKLFGNIYIKNAQP